MSEANTGKKRGYNLAVNQLTTANRSKNVNGRDKITFRGKTTVGGREIERTFVAQGKAAELISGMVRKGNTLNLRVIFERAPSNEDGKRGGEFCSVVALPRAKKAA